MERREDLEETFDLLLDVLTTTGQFLEDHHRKDKIYLKFYEVLEMNEEYLKDASNPWTSEALKKIAALVATGSPSLSQDKLCVDAKIIQISSRIASAHLQSI